ncbi:MAG: hypothetical protein FWC38_01920 [Proteobacteria bacterium]|nr:hypothetical protein [Pseudomonadota bacterium]MCL2306998.1 hypothetical protein [Pseudomonadota bacterium]
MHVISSRSTFISYKYLVLPLLWLLLIFVYAIIGSAVRDGLGIGMLAAMLLLAFAVSWRFYCFMKPFADEVLDMGDALLVRKSGEQAHIPLIDIASFEDRSHGRNDTYYLITMRAPSILGGEIAFFPSNNVDGTPWRSRNESIYDSLSRRISQAREKRF